MSSNQNINKNQNQEIGPDHNGLVSFLYFLPLTSCKLSQPFQVGARDAEPDVSPELHY